MNDSNMKTNGLKVKITSISLSPEIMEYIDNERGLIPRSTYIDDCFRKQLGKKKASKGVT